MTTTEAFIKANQDFDLLILPNANHSLEPHMSYFTRKKWDYFVKNSGSAGLRVPEGPTEIPDSLLSEDKADRSPKAPNR